MSSQQPDPAGAGAGNPPSQPAAGHAPPPPPPPEGTPTPPPPPPGSPALGEPVAPGFAPSGGPQGIPAAPVQAAVPHAPAPPAPSAPTPAPPAPAPPAPQSTPPAWLADPYGRHEARWWDGTRWTEAVVSHGRQDIDPPGGTVTVTTNRRPDQIVQDVQAVGGSAGVGGGTIFTEPVLVVNQKAKLIEVNTEYAVYDQHGRQIGAVRQVGQSALKKAARIMTSYDAFMTHTYQIVDHTGQVAATLTRPRKVIKSRLIVSDAAGRETGQIMQQNAFGKIRFSMESGGHQWGSINAENWRAWNFAIQDHTGVEVARITKKFAGLKAAFTTADNYVVQIHRPLQEPLRTLVVTAALGIDNALHQTGTGAA